MATQQEVIKKFMASLDNTTLSGETALNAAIKYATNYKYYTIQEVIDAMIKDCQNAKSADDFLKTYCGINLENDDTGAITGSDAGGSTEKTAESIVPEKGALIEFTSGTWFTTEDGLIVMLGERIAPKDESDNMREKYFEELSEQEIYIWRAIYTWWIEGGLKLISDSYGDNYSFASTTAATKKLWIVFDYYEDEPDSTELMATWGGPVHARKSTNDIKIHVNMNYYDTTSGENGKSEDASLYFDRCMAHELTHAVMRANINYFDYLPAFVKEGMAELTHGIDDFRTNDIEKLAGDYSLLAQSLVFDEETVTISGVDNPSYAGGYMFLRYLARQMGDLTINNSTSYTTVETFNGNDSIESSGSNVTISSGFGNDSVSAYGDKILVDASTGNNFVHFYSDAYNITLNGGTGNDTVESAAIGATINTGNGKDSIYLYSNAQNHTIDSGDDADSIYSGAQTTSINAGAGNDYVHIYTNATNNTINAGTGNDSIKSYNTNGVRYEFAAGDGDDTINGFMSNDTISLSGSKYYTKETTNSSVKISLVSGSGSMTLLDASDKTINVEGSTLLNVINNRINSKKITAGNGEDSITNHGNKVTIVGASDIDSIWNYGANVSINGNGGNDYLDNRGSKITLLGGAGNDTLRNDTYNGGAKNVKLSGGDGDDYISNWGDNVTMLGGAGKDSIYNNASGLNGSGKKVSIDGGSDNDYIRNFGKDSTLKGGAGDDTIGNYAKAYMNGKLAADNVGKNVKIFGGAGADSIENSGANVTISGGAGNDEIINSGVNGSINGSDGNDTLKGGKYNEKLYGGKHNDSISGGAGKDTLSGGSGKDILTGGKGKDTFIFSAGNDTITDYKSGDDTISISSGLGNAKFSVGGEKKKDVVLTYGKNSLIVTNGLNKKISFINETTGTYTKSGIFNDNKTAVTLPATSKTFKATSETYSKLETIDGSAADSTINITGNGKNNYLVAGDNDATLTGGKGKDTLVGGKGNDSLWGGAGDDSLYGGDGKDTFIYKPGEGTDKIFDYNSNDILTILKADGSEGGTFKSSKFSGGDLTLTIKGGGKVIFDSAGNVDKFNINGTSYKISGSKLVK